MIKFILSVPKKYCEIKGNEAQRAADYLHREYDYESFGYIRGDLAQAIANFWFALCDVLPPKNKLL